MVHQRSRAILFAASLLFGVALPALSPGAAALASVSYDFSPGQSAFAMRTDPSWVRCFQMRFDAVVPGPPAEAMAAIYLMDGNGRMQFTELHYFIVGQPYTVNVSLRVMTPQGTVGGGLAPNTPTSPGPWQFNISRQHCISNAAVHQTTVFAAVTSKGVTSARATLTALDGDLKFPRYVTGTGFLHRNENFTGVAAYSQLQPRTGVNALVKDVVISEGFVGSFFTFDSAYALSVTGDAFARPETESGVCDSGPNTNCVAVGTNELGTFALRGGAATYRFMAASASTLQPSGPASAIYLLGADIRLPISV